MAKEKREWNAGPWDDEPETFDFTDDVTGYPIAMRRNNFGAWCGYIGVPAGHALVGKSYSDEVRGAKINGDTTMDQVGVITALCHALGSDENPRLDLLVRCHGGLTYAQEAWWPDETRAEWWFGFDCSHSEDRVPAKDMYSMSRSGTYRNIEYVKSCCRTAAADLARFKTVTTTQPIVVQTEES